jgi:hypothetical protein
VAGVEFSFLQIPCHDYTAVKGQFHAGGATSRNVQNATDRSVAANVGSRKDAILDGLYLLWQVSIVRHQFEKGLW